MPAPQKVLVVDDNPVNLQIFDEILSEDYRVRRAINGNEAIKEAAEFQPSVILLDVMMPGMDGIEICKRMRQLPGVGDATIIMVSAKAMPSEQAEGLAAGADEYITKPFDEVELIAMLRRYRVTGADRDMLSSEKCLHTPAIAAY